MVAVWQEVLTPCGGALRAGTPVQVGWRDCLGGARSGLLRGPLGQPRLLLVLRLHLDGLPGTLGLAGLSLLWYDCVGDLLRSGESQDQVKSLQGPWGGGQRPRPGRQGPAVPPPPTFAPAAPLLSAMQIMPLST